MSDSIIDNIANLSNQARSTGKEPYKAYGGDQSKDRQTNLNIKDKHGNGYLIPYGQIIRIQYTSHQVISLFCADCVFNIEGKNLDKIIDLLQDARVRYVQEFNKNRFIEAGNSAAVIERIKVLSVLGKQDVD